MNLDERLRKVAVLGAGGKMGSGISLLLACEMTSQIRNSGSVDSDYQLTLMDVSQDALNGLQTYLAKQAGKYASRNLNKLSTNYPDMSEETLVSTFVSDMQSILNPVTELEAIPESHLVFEAILEQIELKVKVFSTLNNRLGDTTWYFSNTSSIPLHELDARVNLGGRIIGFHFYNPPAIQKLVELIIPENVEEDLTALSYELGKRMGKIMIPSNDIAGFIGNGHFMRDGLHGVDAASALVDDFGFAGSVYAINRVSQDFMLRPMGIFQLIDYVGLDVFQSILKIMNPHFPEENLHSALIDELLDLGIRGGQYSDGSQRDGFLQYTEGKISGVYDKESGTYQALTEAWKEDINGKLGDLPDGHTPWKSLAKNPDRGPVLAAYFQNMDAATTRGATLARDYLSRSKAIGEQLVDGGVAKNAADVNGVLMNGFFHVYGPINDFV